MRYYIVIASEAKQSVFGMAKSNSPSDTDNFLLKISSLSTPPRLREFLVRTALVPIPNWWEKGLIKKVAPRLSIF